MKAVHLMRHLFQIDVKCPTCPLTGTDCDAPQLRAMLRIEACQKQAPCPMGKHRKIIPLIQLYSLEQKRDAWRLRPA